MQVTHHANLTNSSQLKCQTRGSLLS